VPGLSLHLYELDRQQVLVDLNDLRNDNRHGEILLDQPFVQVQGRLDKLLVVVPVVPDVKFAIEGVSLLCVFLLLELKQGLAILQTDRTEFLLQVVEELDRTSHLNRRIDDLEGGTHTVWTFAAVLTIFTSVM
jgi:hypothetical protein